MYLIDIIKKNKFLFSYGLVESLAKGLNVLAILCLAIVSNLEIYAEIAILIASELLFVELILAGQQKVALRFINKGKKNVEKIISQCSKILFIVFIIIFVFFAILPSNVFIFFLKEDLKIIYLLLIFGSFLTAIINLNLYRLRKENRVYDYAVLRILFQVFKFLLCISLMYVFHNSITYPIAIIITCLFVFGYGAIRSDIFQYIKNIIHHEYNIEHLKFGTPLMFHAIAGILYGQLGRFMLNVLSTSEDLATYHFNVTLGMTSFFVVNVAGLYYTPKIYEGENYDDSSKSNLKKFLNLSLLGSTFTSLIIIFIVYPIALTFVPSEYQAGSTVLYLSCLLIWFSCFSNFAVYKATALKIVKIIPVVTIVSLLISFFLNYTLIPIYGGVGAITSILLSEIFFIIALLLWLKQYD